MDIVNMGSQGRKTYHHGDLRTALLASGLALLDADGPEAVTVRAVAREAGVAHSAPANHFRDRAALLGALAAGIFGELAIKVEKALAAADQTRDAQLHAFAEVVMRYALRYPNRYSLLWRRDCFDVEQSGVEAAGTVLYDRVKAALAKGDSNSKVSVETEVIAAWSLVHGYVSLRIQGTLIDGKDEVSGMPRAAAIVDVLIAGLGGKRPGRGRRPTTV
jgi:AcrR family transcriptional regulator